MRQDTNLLPSKINRRRQQEEIDVIQQIYGTSAYLRTIGPGT